MTADHPVRSAPVVRRGRRRAGWAGDRSEMLIKRDGARSGRPPRPRPTGRPVAVHLEALEGRCLLNGNPATSTWWDLPTPSAGENSTTPLPGTVVTEADA